MLQHYDQSENSQLSLTSGHHRFGTSALEWQWNGTENSFGTSNFRILDRDPKMQVYADIFPTSPTLVFSVYNEEPQEGTVKVSYQKNGEDGAWFNIPLQFKGWRTVRVPFFEMQGHPPEKNTAVDYDYFKVSSDVDKGKLFFDDIVFSQFMDDRHPYPDLMVPLLSGYECLVQIRSHSRLKHLMVIIYSSSFDVTMVDRLYENGADYYLRKPKDNFAFKNTLRTAIGLASANNYRTRNDFVINPFR